MQSSTLGTADIRGSGGDNENGLTFSQSPIYVSTAESRALRAMETSGEEIERFATKLERASERVFEAASIWNTEPEAGAADPKIVAVLLLIRTLSNFRGTLI